MWMSKFYQGKKVKLILQGSYVETVPRCSCILVPPPPPLYMSNMRRAGNYWTYSHVSACSHPLLSSCFPINCMWGGQGQRLPHIPAGPDAHDSTCVYHSAAGGYSHSHRAGLMTNPPAYSKPFALLTFRHPTSWLYTDLVHIRRTAREMSWLAVLLPFSLASNFLCGRAWTDGGEFNHLSSICSLKGTAQTQIACHWEQLA